MADPTPWISTAAPGDTVRRHAPATLRNRSAIADVLATVLPSSGTVLEVASGSGEHCAHFAQRFRTLTWQLSDSDPAARASIAAWCDGLVNTRPALELNAELTDWPLAEAVAVLCINVVHISPWEATLGMLYGCARLLRSGAPCSFTGPIAALVTALHPPMRRSMLRSECATRAGVCATSTRSSRRRTASCWTA